VEDFTLRFYERDEFQRLLEDTSFRNVKATKAYLDAEPNMSDSTIVLACQKP